MKLYSYSSGGCGCCSYSEDLVGTGESVALPNGQKVIEVTAVNSYERKPGEKFWLMEDDENLSEREEV